MFTGIVEEIGTVKSVQSKVIIIEANKIFDDLHLGDSVAVNGTCLTVSSFNNKIFNADITQETLNRTNLGSLKNGSKVNLERAMSLQGRFGGHIVSGHIDGVGTIKSMKKDDNAIILTVEVAKSLMKYIVEKGSITVDGISLTVASLTDNTFSIAVIPHTLKETVLYYKKEGDRVNIENDIIGKYVERLLTFRDDDSKSNNHENNKSDITMEFLLKNGF
ncbi:riboflavin synthase [Brachyspira sp.]|uniref:riboflavin synthase n=1 Tax=Brachyspira sp. TaxID=1977261 RepID=UPI002610BA73|nr:riboflavin synthase [Brachyspira sp.]